MRLTGVAPGAVEAVVLRRMRDALPGPVIHRLVGPGQLRQQGELTLTGSNREALDRGTLAMDLFIAGAGRPVATVRLGLRPGA